MATSVKPRQLLVIIVIVLTFVSSEARNVPQLTTMEKKIHSKFGLREVINNVRNGKWHGKRSMLGGRLERISPAGPDPDHH
ncbi:uncharacterized protein LOC106756006 [Vigna radiata var. radiata]|uniref:Uncharacterized protein LOC106756006 n=1 Tax=Vigna radiata var. radiata TaxID=3916 RepID=A0A1S3TIZ7_VIGRR|nr:uncharacterized protein LOC106756006 [Vigna radiata var. radiata]